MEVTYTMTWHDWQTAFRLGWLEKSMPVRMLLSFMAILCLIMPQAHILLKPSVQLRLRHHTVPSYALKEVLFSEALGLLLLFLVSASTLRKIAQRTVQIIPDGIRVKTEQNTLLLHWRHIRYIIEQGEYICFIGRALAATIVPKDGFPSPAEANAFFDTALRYWRAAKGIATPPAPDMSGVWPPAPCAGDSQE